jgi:hypothetical protein
MKSYCLKIILTNQITYYNNIVKMIVFRVKIKIKIYFILDNFYDKSRKLNVILIFFYKDNDSCSDEST